MRGDAACTLIKDRLADVLVSVVGVEEREVALGCARLPVQGSRGDGFRRIPLEEIGDRIVRAVQALDTEVLVVDEALVLVGGDR